MILAGTGHRPEYLGGHDVLPKLVSYATEALEHRKPERLLSGMALGWDQALAQAAVNLGIPFSAIIPFRGQESIWPDGSKRLYHDLLSRAHEIVVVSQGGYATWKYIKRDQWLVDQSDAMLALWSGIKKGGTYQCLVYAERVGRPIDNLWAGWESKKDNATE